MRAPVPFRPVLSRPCNLISRSSIPNVQSVPQPPLTTSLSPSTLLGAHSEVLQLDLSAPTASCPFRVPQVSSCRKPKQPFPCKCVRGALPWPLYRTVGARVLMKGIVRVLRSLPLVPRLPQTGLRRRKECPKRRARVSDTFDGYVLGSVWKWQKLTPSEDVIPLPPSQGLDKTCP
jgi:hypothetical protein